MSDKKCYACEGTKPEDWFDYRCEEHNTCVACGKKRSEITCDIWEQRIGFICADCRTKRVEDRIKAFQSEEHDECDFYSDDVIICPICGYEHKCDGEDPAFYEDGDHEFTCADCDNKFNVNTYVSTSYQTSKIEESKK